MLYEVNEASGGLKPVISSWRPKELGLERYLISRDSDGPPVLSEAVFGEPLLIVSNEVKTHYKKRADILAMDRAGNGVVIELKRDEGRLGVETQALQYLADFSNYTGESFIKKFSSSLISEEDIAAFVGGNADRKNINSNSRIILVARSFDPSLFSMGEWLSSKGVSFRCVTYTPIQLNDRRMLSFSVAFDRTSGAVFPLSFASTARNPGYYWHNIARANQGWWEVLVRNSQIPACFDDSPGDQGEKLLTSYVPGDTIIAYAKGYGAVGWGEVASPVKYRLLSAGDKSDYLQGSCLHRLKVNWRAVAKQLSDGIPPDVVRRDFGVYHPISTSVSIKAIDAEKLIRRMNETFRNA